LSNDHNTLSQVLEHLTALNDWTQSQDELHLKEQMDELTSLIRSLKTCTDALTKTAALTTHNEKTRAQEHAAALSKLSTLSNEHSALIETSKQEHYKLQDRLSKSLALNENLSKRSPWQATIQDNWKPIAFGTLSATLILLTLFALMFFYIPKMNSAYVTMTSESFQTIDTEARHGRTWLNYLRNLPKEQADPLFSMIRDNHPPSSHPLCLTTPPQNSDASNSNDSSTPSSSTDKSSKKNAKRKP
jgi:Fe2+ transport system protein B